MHSQLWVAMMLTEEAMKFVAGDNPHPSQIEVAKILARRAIAFLEGASK